jgi:general stress protein 26
MEFEKLWESVLNDRFNRARMNLSELPLKIQQSDSEDTIVIAKSRGSEGEHLLQSKYQTKDRAIRFDREQVFDKLNKNMSEFIRQTDLTFVSTWGKGGTGCNIELNVGNKYILNPNILIIETIDRQTLENIKTNPHITLYYVDFVDKQLGLHVNGKVRIISGTEILRDSQYIDRDIYGLPDEPIPLELIEQAKIDIDRSWLVVTTEECYIDRTKHILAHIEIEKTLPGTGNSEPAKLELVTENILKAEMFFLATADRNGETDCSLRAGPRGFIEIHDRKIRYPEYRGNGVVASLGNITENPQVTLAIVNFCSVSQKTILIKGIAKIIDEEISSPIDNVAKKAIEHWIEIDPIEIEIRHEKFRPLYQKSKDRRKVPWGTDEGMKKTSYFIEK